MGEARHPPSWFWTTLIGRSSQEIIYMLVWDSMAEREKRWGAFLADPEWAAVVAKTEKEGQLVENVSCPSSNGLGQSELFRDGGSGSFGLEFRRLSTDVSIVAV
jgi:hypothetical protein